MIRPLVLAGLAATLLAAPAAAQTWGQPVYVGAYGHVVGGTPLSEIETRSYVETGRWADGYTDQPHVYVPAPAYGRGYSSRYGYGSGYGRYGYGYGRDRRYDRHDGRSRVGYRDEWGYNDDRPPSRYRSNDGYRRGHDRGCGCADVYLYDR